MEACASALECSQRRGTHTLGAMRPLGFRTAPSAALIMVAIGLLLVPGSGQALTGSKRISISAAPWAVAIVKSTTPPSVLLMCTGVIVDRLHVLTAAHCVRGTNPHTFHVLAGQSNFGHPRSGEAPQTRLVASYRLHPAGALTDLAVLRLAAPLHLDGTRVSPIALRRSNTFAANRVAVVAGFGEETRGQPSTAGPLTEITQRVDRQGRCGQLDLGSPDSALDVCASSSVAGVCLGDSGAGLVAVGLHPVLLGILTLIPVGGDCTAHNTGQYTYVGAPEVWRFLTGDNHPPQAPRTWSLIAAEGLSWRVGESVLCGGADVGRAHTRYELALTGRLVRVSGHLITYRVTRADVGKRFTCKGSATTTGGTSVDQWTSAPVRP